MCRPQQIWQNFGVQSVESYVSGSKAQPEHCPRVLSRAGPEGRVSSRARHRSATALAVVGLFLCAAADKETSTSFRHAMIDSTDRRLYGKGTVMSGANTYREYQYVCVWPTEHTAAAGECGCQGESGLEIPLLPGAGGLPAMQLVNETIYTSNAWSQKLYTDHDFAFGWNWVPSFPYVAGICGGDIKVVLPPCRVLPFSYQSDVRLRR